MNNNNNNNNNNVKVFSKYKMSYKEDMIEIVLDSNDKETMFTYTFYNDNKEYLDTFKNIMLFVKPKREQTKSNSIVINLDDFTASYSANNDSINEEDLNLAIKILKNTLIKENPELKVLRDNLFIKNNDLKMLIELSKDFDLTQEIEKLKNDIKQLEKELEEKLGA